MRTMNERLKPFGTSIFAEMSRLAAAHRAVNLSQGFPDFDGPEFVKEAAAKAMRDGHNQYARMAGVAQLNEALAARWKRLTGLSVDADSEITVTCGCTQAVAATFLGLLNPGDEVIVFEPFYDSYPAVLAMAGASARVVTLKAPDAHATALSGCCPKYSFDPAQLRAAVTPRTRAILLNTPSNPTGKVFTREEMALIAEVCIANDLIAVTDEVYEHLVFDGEHIRLATLPGMAERTITLSSLGKTFSLTGWKVGWVIAPRELSAAVRSAHQFLTFSIATPLQYGALAAINAPAAYFNEFLAEYARRRAFLCDALREVGFGVHVPQGTYFVMADHRPFGFTDDMTFCRHLVEQVGVAAIPPSVFYRNPAEGRHLVRFAFCKKIETMEAAVERMRKGLKAR